MVKNNMFLLIIEIFNQLSYNGNISKRRWTMSTIRPQNKNIYNTINMDNTNNIDVLLV